MPKKPQHEVLQVELLETDQGYVEGVALVWTDGEYLPVVCWGGPWNGTTRRIYPPQWRDGCIMGPTGDDLPKGYVLVVNVKGALVLVPEDEPAIALRKTRPPVKRAKPGKPAAP